VARYKLTNYMTKQTKNYYVTVSGGARNFKLWGQFSTNI